MTNASRARAAAAYVGHHLSGGYRIRSVLDTGGSGFVFLADEIGGGRSVGVKVLCTTDPVSVRRFQREARAVSNLRHPTLCEVYGFGQLDAFTHYLVMEHLVGETLRDRITQGGPMRLGDVIAIASQLLDG